MGYPTSIRLSDDLRAKLDAMAARERRSLSNLVNILLEDAVAAEDRKRKAKRRPRKKGA